MLFPELNGKMHGRVDLDAEARAYAQARGWSEQDPNPFLQADVCQDLLDHIHLRDGIAFSYGGWMEDRRFLWRGSYLERTGAFLHLGVDFNVPAGTLVAVDHDVVVAEAGTDFPEEHGWGSYVVVQPEGGDRVLAYAHLAPDVACKPGDRLRRGTVFARVGRPPANGGWFPHLHVQSCDRTYYERDLRRGEVDVDGYGDARDRLILSRRFPDPMDLFALHPLPAPVS